MDMFFESNLAVASFNAGVFKDLGNQFSIVCHLGYSIAHGFPDIGLGETYKTPLFLNAFSSRFPVYLSAHPRLVMITSSWVRILL